MEKSKMAPLHPGEVLQQEFLEPMGLSQNKLSLALHVPARRINEIVLGKRGVSADTALRLARYFDMSPQFWLGLQMDFELDVAEDSSEERIKKEIRPMTGSGSSALAPARGIGV
ncbi:MAG: addiction module antidote protein, HigA family [Candidatus Electrothrix sp. AR1]|nr:addiction module antidote protein, HigA family [Candidatus Electrothrix sp. AR1]